MILTLSFLQILLRMAMVHYNMNSYENWWKSFIIQINVLKKKHKHYFKRIPHSAWKFLEKTLLSHNCVLMNSLYLYLWCKINGSKNQSRL